MGVIEVAIRRYSYRAIGDKNIGLLQEINNKLLVTVNRLSLLVLVLGHS